MRICLIVGSHPVTLALAAVLSFTGCASTSWPNPFRPFSQLGGQPADRDPAVARADGTAAAGYVAPASYQEPAQARGQQPCAAGGG